MRVTNQLLANTLNSNLSRISEKLLKAQEQISSGKRINRPSDDPIGMGKVLDFRTTISQIDQYNRNITNGQGWLQLTDSTLSDIDNLITSAKTLAVSQATETSSAQTRADTAEEVKNIIAVKEASGNIDQVMKVIKYKPKDFLVISGDDLITLPIIASGGDG